LGYTCIQDDLESGVIQPKSSGPKKIKLKTYGTGIGKYINKGKRENEENLDSEADSEASKKKKGKRALNDFSEW